MPFLSQKFPGLGWLSLSALLCSSAPLLAGQAILKQTEADLRKKQIENVQYTLDIDLPEADVPYQGTVRMDFVFHPQKQKLRVDFTRGSIESVKINGKTAAYDVDDKALYLNEELFAKDSGNQLEIRFAHPYSKDGTGLYWFRDPVDQKSYTYTQFEPYSANSFMPCFDQPDLKATYQLTARAPRTWTVVSANRESRITEAGEKRVWEFPRTQRFATYVFSLHAGPYHVWEDKTFRLPLRVMARESMATYMPVDSFFTATRHGLDFFDKYLGFAFPFGKYDQVVVPDFNAGAMENVAAVTFSERFLVRGQRTIADEQGLSSIILHEMAHMWFGDLVTMRWWNDLWLNESFATYASSLGMAADPRFPNAWLSFARSKSGAYYADQLVTTHPIVSLVPDTESASTVFDGITYGKGSAFLKQLHFVLGDKAFQKGLQTYFQTHAYGNTQVGDFIKAMEIGSGRSLAAFAKDWLETAGVNRLAVDYSCSKGRINRFQLKQTATNEQPTLREHRTQVALYRLKNGHFQEIKAAPVRYQGSVTNWPEAKGLSCPDLVLPNQGDYDYVKVVLDPKSLKVASDSLHLLEDPMQRTMMWNTLADMIVDTEISLKDFSRFVVQQLPREEHYDVLRTIDGKVGRELLGYVNWINDKGTQDAILTELVQAYEARLQAGLSADAKQMLWSTYVDLLASAGRTQTLLDIWQGKVAYPGVTIDQDERWTLLQSLSQLGSKDALSWAETEAKKDATSAGHRKALAVQAAFPDYERKMRLLEPLVQLDKPVPNAERRAVLSNLFPGSQKELLKRYEATFRQQLDVLVKNAEPSVTRAYAGNLLPVSCDATTLPLLQELIAKPYPESLHETFLVARQSNERCQKVMSRLLNRTQG